MSNRDSRFIKNMGKSNAYIQFLEGQKGNKNLQIEKFKKELQKSANTFLDVALIDEQSLEKSRYDFNTFTDICTLLYEFPSTTLLNVCYNNVVDNVRYSNYAIPKVVQAYKLGKIEEMFDTVIDTLIPLKYVDMDEVAKLRIMRILLGYFLYTDYTKESKPTGSEDMLRRAILTGLSTMFAEYTLKFAQQKRGVPIDIEEVRTFLGTKPLGFGKDIVVKDKIFKEKTNVRYGVELATFFNAYSEYYTQNKETVDLTEVTVVDALKGIANKPELDYIVELGKKSLTEEDILKLAEKNLTEELWSSYKSMVLRLKAEYYIVTGSIRSFISERVIETLIKEERADFNEKLRIANTDLKTAMQDVKNYRRSIAKVEKDLDMQRVLLQEKETEIEKLKADSQSTCTNDELLKVQQELERVKAENEKQAQEIQKYAHSTKWSKDKIAGLEDRIKEFENLTGNLVELQQENMLLMQSVEEIEDLTSAEEEHGDELFNYKYNQLKDMRIQFLGGLLNMGARLKEIFPNSEYIDINEKNESYNIPETMEVIVIYTRKFKHSYSSRAYSLAKGRPVILVDILNTKLTVNKIYEQLVGHK